MAKNKTQCKRIAPINCQEIIKGFLVNKKIVIYERGIIKGEYKGKLTGHYFDKGIDNEFFKFNPVYTTIKGIDFNNREEREHYGDVLVLTLEYPNGELINMSAYDYTNFELTL